MGDEDVLSQLKATFDEVQGAFERQRRVLSFDEYVSVFRTHPERHSRDAASYLCDMVQYYGRESVERPLGKASRYKVFDQAFLPDKEAESHALIGQEAVQEAIVRSLNNFKREGLANRVLLLHGPNGSSKSTIASCLMAGLEDYSTKDEGALYRFHWVFPKKATMKGAIGFSGGKEPIRAGGASYAHLNDDQIETKLIVEVRDHPLFLIPVQARQKLLKELVPRGVEISGWLGQGSLCQKNQQIFSALLTSYEGSLAEVLRHVRVERYFISRRYRVGAVTLGPELSVDAHERQVTADQNLGALPASLQGLSLYDVSGELVDASGGLLELSDLLKRPIDAYKYLQTTVETGQVSVGSQSLLVNCVMLASGNELHLSAFREHPEYESFRGRFQLIAVPYLCDYRLEQEIYDRQIAKRIATHVAPHATAVAARFAVLTRLLKPVEEHYEAASRLVVTQMTAWEKMRAYAGELREFELEGKKVPMKQLTREMGKEWEASHVYEGIFGVSPRVMRTVLLEAAQDQNFQYLSPFAVLDELDRLCEKEEDYAFLRQEPRPGGFHDHVMFRQRLRDDLLDILEDEFRVASGLVEDTSYEELLTKYVMHVSAWVKSEKLKDPLTGAMQPPDAGLMEYVEGLLNPSDRGEDARRALLSRIAAWAIDHPKQKIAQSGIFSDKLAALRAAVFRERRSLLGDFCRRFVEQLQEGAALDKQVTLALSVMESRFGYSQAAARDAAGRLVTERFQDLGQK
jgi:serine protein kinase